jgi:hypothetical protein
MMLASVDIHTIVIAFFLSILLLIAPPKVGAWLPAMVIFVGPQGVLLSRALRHGKSRTRRFMLLLVNECAVLFCAGLVLVVRLRFSGSPHFWHL